MVELKAVIFDQDGVIADTERDGHRIAFNRAFEEFGLNVEWDVKTYGQLVKIGGGKERMHYYFLQKGLDKNIKDIKALIKEIHKRKTEIFMEIIEKGQIKPRPGITRLIKECHDGGMKLAVCSTANERAVHTLLRILLGNEAYEWFDLILAGDVVERKKPDPQIYNLAKERLTVSSQDCIVIEDSQNGLLAARGAGIKCIITVNEYTRGEDFAGANLVLTSLGDIQGEKAEILAGGKGLPFGGEATLPLLRKIIEREG